jgi:carbon-monoxide dehydrogenase iron sulfur subunit
MSIDSETGVRYINEEECIKCGSCYRACPFSPSLVWVTEANDKKRYYKCDLCRGREDGPICEEVCPRGALTYEQRGKSK